MSGESLNLSTPSLGITSQLKDYDVIIDDNPEPFNSLSRDHV